MASLEPSAVRELTIENLTSTVVSSNRVEGRILDASEVHSSVVRQLGIDTGEIVGQTHTADGPAMLMVDATVNYDQPLTVERLLGWHRLLFKNEDCSDIAGIGKWRDDVSGTAQVLRGPVNRWRNLYQPPPSTDLDAEIDALVDWLERPGETDPVVRAAIAHLWFMTLYPFDAGNGQLATALTEMALARAEGTSERCYSISEQSYGERAPYYRVLQHTQNGTLDISEWLQWYLECFEGAIEVSENRLSRDFARARFWRVHQNISFNERQRGMLDLLLRGHKEEIKAAEWATNTGRSHFTAVRDINDLIDQGILERMAGEGRLTSYALSGDWKFDEESVRERWRMP